MSFWKRVLAQKPKPEKIATIEERSDYGSFGILSIGLLIGSAGLTALAVAVDSSAIRQAAEAAMGTAAIAFFGFGAILGRKRRFIVYRERPTDPP